ncbi:MAG: T9SS type A sorting domain-containing protein [Flavobacteriales bacterium]|nr:T9SS type A sorting domain-containing protein [Flavobacteriales bacterium]
MPVELDLWPNPTSGLLNLPAEPAWVRAQVYDLRGRSVLDRTGRQAILDVAALAPGAYTLMLRDPLGRAVARGTFVRE